MTIKHRTFGEFVDKQKREAVRQLKILGKIFEHNGLKVETFLEGEKDDDPYVYVFNPSQNGSFDGIRLYKIGDQLAFRVQKENKTHPYGSAYPIPVEEMFQDFLSDDGVDEQKAGVKVIESVAKEIKKFFERSIETEREDRQSSIDKDKEKGNILMRTTGTDYSSLVYNKA